MVPWGSHSRRVGCEVMKQHTGEWMSFFPVVKIGRERKGRGERAVSLFCVGREEVVLDLRQRQLGRRWQEPSKSPARAQHVQQQRLECSAMAWRWGWGGEHQRKEAGLELSGRGRRVAPSRALVLLSDRPDHPRPVPCPHLSHRCAQLMKTGPHGCSVCFFYASATS